MKACDMNTVGGRIRAVRKNKHLTIQKLADEINVTGNYLGLVERGERNPSLELLNKISQSTGADLEWLQSVETPTTLPINSQPACVTEAVPDEESYNGRAHMLIISFDKLSVVGQLEALRRINELARLPEYRKRES